MVEVASPDPDGTWRSVVRHGLESTLRLEALGVELGLDEVFARVTFAASPGAPPAEAPGR